MDKLADISTFERLQGNSNAGMVSGLSVFNGEYTKSIVELVKQQEEGYERIAQEYGGVAVARGGDLAAKIGRFLVDEIDRQDDLHNKTFSEIYYLLRDECSDAVNAVRDMGLFTEEEWSEMDKYAVNAALEWLAHKQKVRYARQMDAISRRRDELRRGE